MSNPAHSVRAPKYSTHKVKTSVLSSEETRELLDSLDTSHVVGLRDRGLIGLMVYTFARVGAVVTMCVEDYYQQGRRWWVRLHEKGGKPHTIALPPQPETVSAGVHCLRRHRQPDQGSRIW